MIKMFILQKNDVFYKIRYVSNIGTLRQIVAKKFRKKDNHGRVAKGIKENGDDNHQDTTKSHSKR